MPGRAFLEYAMEVAARLCPDTQSHLSHNLTKAHFSVDKGTFFSIIGADQGSQGLVNEPLSQSSTAFL